MAIWKKRAREPTKIPVGRISGTETTSGYISSYRNRTTNLLKRLRRTTDAAEAIRLLAREHPDMSMAVGNLIYLSNQGHTMEFSGPGGRLTQAEEEWKKFCKRVYADSAAGLDGLVNTLHKSSFTRSGMAFEVVVEQSGRDIEDVYPIDPMSIHWEAENRNGRHVFVPYQYDHGRKIDLSKGNFFWIPFDPDVGSPRGNLMLQSAIQAIDHQMELYQNLNTVLYRIGTPRYDVKIDTQRVADYAPPEARSTPEKLMEYLRKTIDHVREQFRAIGPENDLVHSDDAVIDVVGGGAGMNGVDARSFKEIADTEVLNGTQMLGVLMNRYDSKTNALSSTEFQIMVNKIDARRRDSKRAVEAIADIWLRVHGYNAAATFTHNPIEWETMIDKYTALLKRQEYYRRGEEYGWIGPDEAAGAVMGAAQAHDALKGKAFRFFEYIKKKFSLVDVDETVDGENAPEKNERKEDE